MAKIFHFAITDSYFRFIKSDKSDSKSRAMFKLAEVLKLSKVLSVAQRIDENETIWHFGWKFEMICDIFVK